MYLNENLSDEIAQRLRMNDIDAVSSHETGMDAREDDEQLQFAVAQGRAIVSINKKDYRRLNARYKANGWEHEGIILSRDIDHSIIYKRLLRLVSSLQAEDIRNRIIRLHQFR